MYNISWTCLHMRIYTYIYIYIYIYICFHSCLELGRNFEIISSTPLPPYYGLIVVYRRTAVFQIPCCCCSVSHVWLFATPWTAAHQTSLSFTVSWSLLILMSIESVMPSNHLVLCHPLLLLPSSFPSISPFQLPGSLHQVAS